jgi:hypothetical protein
MLLGRDLVPVINNTIEAPIVELLEMHHGDKLLICFKSTLSDEFCRHLHEQFEVALKGDKRVLVMGSEVPKFVVLRGLETKPERAELKIA